MLILDGDGPAYRVAATVKRLDTAIRRYQQDMLTQLFLTGSQSVRIHLTASNSDKAGRFRIKAAKPYQGNRNGKDKPSLLEPLREAMTDRSNWLAEFDEVIMHRLKEADDGMITDAYMYKESGVVWSDDKDLSMTPYPQWDRTAGVLMPSDPVGSLSMKYSAAGVGKCVGRSLLFFWAQMLMGDSADNVKGVITLNGKTCGAVGAYDHLKDVKSINEAANLVLDAYRVIGQNPLPEGYLLFLHRTGTDNFWSYLNELELSINNRVYLDECVLRDWFVRMGD